MSLDSAKFNILVYHVGRSWMIDTCQLDEHLPRERHAQNMSNRLKQRALNRICKYVLEYKV